MTSTTSASSCLRMGVARGCNAAEGARENFAVVVVEGERRRAGGGTRRLRSPRARDRDDGRGEIEEPGERDFGRSRVARGRDLGERLLAGNSARPSRPAERRVRDQRETLLDAALQDSASKRAVVEGTERDLDSRDRRELERLVQLAAVDVRDAHAPHQAFVDETAERADSRSPRRAGIGRVDEVEVDRQAVQRGEAPLAVAADRLRASVRDPPAAHACHAALRDDARAPSAPQLRRARTRRRSLWPSSFSSLPVAVRGVEDGDAGVGRGRDRLECEPPRRGSRRSTCACSRGRCAAPSRRAIQGFVRILAVLTRMIDEDQAAARACGAARCRDVLGPGTSSDVVPFGSAVLGGLKACRRSRRARRVEAVDLRAESRTRLADRLLAISGRGRLAPRRARPSSVPSRGRSPGGTRRGSTSSTGLARGEFESGNLEPWPTTTNPDVASLITMALLADRPLLGPPPAEVFDPVPRDDLVRANVGDIDSLLADLDPDTTNVVLTLARIWSTAATGEIRSKDAAADWALDRLDEEQRAVLARARAVYLGEAEDRGRPSAGLRAHAGTSSLGSAGDRRAKAVGAEGGLSAATTSTVVGVVSLGTVRRSAPVLEAASRTQTRIGRRPRRTRPPRRWT